MADFNNLGGMYTSLGIMGNPYPSLGSMYPEIPVPTTTEGGAAIWARAQQLAAKYDEMNAAQIVRRAMEITGVAAYEVTQEDMRAIEMALEVIISQRKPKPPEPNPSGFGRNLAPELSSSPGFFGK